MLPLKEIVPELKSDFSSANDVVTSPALPKPSASDPAMKATLAFSARFSEFSDLLETTTGDSPSFLSLSFSHIRRTGRFAAERSVQCQSSGSVAGERRAGRNFIASASVLNVRLIMRRAPERRPTFSRRDGRKEEAVTL